MEPLYETDEHRSLREQARRFARAHIKPHAHAWDEAEEFPRELYRLAAEAGVLGIGYAEELGGHGGDLSHALAASEELVLEGQNVGVVVGLGSHGIALPPIVRVGTQAQKDRFIKPVLAGEKISALAITEPGGGSDVASLKTRAERDGDHYVVTGSKMFITSGCRADFVTTAVRTGGPGHGGVSLLVIERDTPGFIVSKKLKKTGWWASDTAEITFDHCRVPVANLVGEENQGFVPIMMNFATERVYLAGQAVAIAELCYRESIAYARDRHAFGKALTGFQVTRHKLADMATEVMAAKTVVYQVAQRLASGVQALQEVAMAKNLCAETAVRVTYEAVQLHGGMGYMRESLVERLSRDARLLPIGGGTQEIMKEIIAKSMGF